MKKAAAFFGGLIVGVLGTLLVLYFMYNVDDQPEHGVPGLSMFSEKGECIPTEGKIEVFQVLDSYVALAEAGEWPDEFVVLVVNYDDMSYYDGQDIKIPAGECARQIGTYQYTTTEDFRKTVPVVVIE